jgi:uncharacterized protein YciI
MNVNPLDSTNQHPRRGGPADEAPSESIFVVLLTYTAPLTHIDELLDAHRAWLDLQYVEGRFLASGPQEPRTGGLILARGGSRHEILDVISNDPFHRAAVATYEVVEFVPTRGPLAAALRGGA